MEQNFDVIYNPSLDAYFNLAAEEYLIDRDDARPVFMLWRNDNAVIIGRSQNAYSEINEPFVRERGIKVVRRLTGGGAVFHDAGNVNYTFIVPREESAVLNFERFSAPVIDALRGLGADARLSGRNDIVVGDRKVSGNAQCVRHGKIMHHGTLLWSADMSAISGSLRVDPDKIASKGIKSVRSRVANLRDLTGSDMTAEEFIDYLFSHMEATPRAFDPDETAAIRALSESRYSTWEWNWGESRDFSASRKRYFPFGLVEIRCDAVRGVIGDVSVTGDFFGVDEVSGLESRLRGVRLEMDALTDALADCGRFVAGSTPEELAALMLDPN